MGVYIDMEKPKRCIEEWDFGLMGNPCKFLETDMSCLLQPESEPFDCGENYNTCPLIEIPTPHGRLIDGDNILIAMGDRKKSLIEAFNLHHIIEAEE